MARFAAITGLLFAVMLSARRVEAQIVNPCGGAGQQCCCAGTWCASRTCNAGLTCQSGPVIFGVTNYTCAAPANAAQFLSQSVPASVLAGQTFQVSVTMKNIGTKVWDGNYRLGDVNAVTAPYPWKEHRMYLPAAVQPGETHTFTSTLTASAAGGSYPFKWRMVQELVEWFGDQTPVLTVIVTAPAGGTTAPPPSPPGGSCGQVGTNAFYACYYDNMDFTDLKVTRTEPKVDFDWGAGSPDPLIGPDTFSARWEGDFPFEAGDWDFSATIDDGVRLYVDGALLLESWKDQAPTLHRVTKALTSGTHRIKVEYYENGGGAAARVGWSKVVPAAAGANTPKGSHDWSRCDVITGWTCDPDNYAQPLEVHVYDGPAGVGKNPVEIVRADNVREEAVGALCGQSRSHGFSLPTPSAFKDGRQHSVYVYAINVPSGPNPELPTAERLLTCAGADTTAPTASITSPAAGAVVSGVVNVTAAASDDVGVTRVELYMDGALKGTTTSLPAGFGLSTVGMTEGVHTLTVRAYDAAGNAGTSAPVSVTVRNQASRPPAPSLTAPAAGAVAVSLAPTFQWQDVVGETAYVVDLTEDPGFAWFWNKPVGANVASLSWPATWDMLHAGGRASPSQLGAVRTYYWRVSSWNGSLSAMSQTRSFVTQAAADAPPTAAITSPAAGETVSGVVPVAATAADDVGVTKVELYAGGVLAGTVTLLPAQFGLNTTTLPEGPLVLTVKAYDASGQSGTSAPVTVTVKNQSGIISAEPNPCAIPAGATTCAATVSWTAFNAPVACVFIKETGDSFACGASGSRSAAWISETPATFELRASNSASAALLASVQARGTPPEAASGTLSAFPNPCAIPAGGSSCSASISWTAKNAPNACVMVKETGQSFACGTAGSVGAPGITATPITFELRESNSMSAPLLAAVQVRGTVAPDVTAPTVGIVFPADGATVASRSGATVTPLTVSASASDAVGVTEVRFYLDGALRGTDTGAPFSIAWDTTQVPNGAYVLTAEARDAAGNVGRSEAVHVTVNNPPPPDDTAPTAYVTAPREGDFVSGGVTVAAAASDDRELAGVEFYVDGTLAGSDASAPYSFTWDAGRASTGTHALHAKAYDKTGNSGTSPSIAVVVDASSPSLRLLGVADGTALAGTVQVSAEADDDVGVARVEFWVDDALARSDSVAPYSFSWQTTGLVDGAHALLVKVYDRAGRSAQASARVIVANIPPSVRISYPSEGAPMRGRAFVIAEAGGTVPVRKLELFVDGQPVASSPAPQATLPWNTTAGSNGEHRVQVRAEDAAGNVGSSAEVSVFVVNPESDSAPPTAALTAPSAGATLSATVELRAEAADDTWVEAVEFNVDGGIIGRDADRPFSVLWDTRGTADGPHLLTARAVDIAGRGGVSPGVSVTVRNIVIAPLPPPAPPAPVPAPTPAPPPTEDSEPPVVSITAPRDGDMVFGTIMVSAEALDDSGVTVVELFLDGARIAEKRSPPYAFSIAADGLLAGGHTLMAKAYDAAGNVGGSPMVTVRVDAPVPAVPPPSETPPPPAEAVIAVDDAVFIAPTFTGAGLSAAVEPLKSAPVPPAMAAGRDYLLSLAFHNTGTSVWMGGEYEIFGVSSGPWNGARAVLPLGVLVWPGYSYAFTFKVRAPAAPGRYLSQWRLRHAGREFGETSGPAAITVAVSSPETVLRLDKAAVEVAKGAGGRLNIVFRGANFKPGAQVLYSGGGGSGKGPARFVDARTVRAEIDPSASGARVASLQRWSFVVQNPDGEQSETVDLEVGEGGAGTGLVREVFAYPNPALKGRKPTLRVVAGAPLDSLEFRVYDVAGDKAHEATLPVASAGLAPGGSYTYEYPIDADLPTGVYLYVLRLTSSGASEQKTGKIAIVR